MVETSETAKVPGYAISDEVKHILKIRRLLAQGIPRQMQMLQQGTSELKEMATLADRIDMQVPQFALNEIQGQKG
jgi:hypothetical protein